VIHNNDSLQNAQDEQNFLGFRITLSSLPDPLLEALSSAAQQHFNEIECATQQRDVRYIKRIEEFIREYPYLPKLYNFLEGLYIIDGQDDKAKKLAQIMYDKFPYYLFAKVAYANYCMEVGRVDEFTRIFEGKSHLKELYPYREEFHVSEFLAFTDVVCIHACHKKNFGLVRKLIKELKSMPFDLDHVVEVLEARLNNFEQPNRSFMEKVLDKIQQQRPRTAPSN
jgi:hypothetical protein